MSLYNLKGKEEKMKYENQTTKVVQKDTRQNGGRKGVMLILSIVTTSRQVDSFILAIQALL